MMNISRRQYFCNFFIMLFILGVLIFIGAPILNTYTYSIPVLNEICRDGLIIEIIVLCIIALFTIISHHGIKGAIRDLMLRHSIESSLLSIGAYTKLENKVYVVLPSIRIKKNAIHIKLKDLRLRTILERYLNTFSTALPQRFIVTEYYFSQDNSELIIEYEDLKTYKPEVYSISDYIKLIKSTKPLELYFDNKHIVNLNDYPHFLLSGSSGSGKSYLANQLVMQAIIKEWEVVVLDVKRSYGLYGAYIDYQYDFEDIISKLLEIESEMTQRLMTLQPTLDKNPTALAIDVGYKPKLVIIEEYISLMASLDKKQKEELERAIKNLSVLARQTNIHLIMVMQSAHTENINSSIRNNLTKIMMGNAQSNVVTATFGTGVELPNLKMRFEKGEGLIQLKKITRLRVPKISDIDNFNDVFGRGAES